jgi:hypothetical protein
MTSSGPVPSSQRGGGERQDDTIAPILDSFMATPYHAVRSASISKEPEEVDP